MNLVKAAPTITPFLASLDASSALRHPFFNKHLGLNVGLGQDELQMAFDVLKDSSPYTQVLFFIKQQFYKSGLFSPFEG